MVYKPSGGKKNTFKAYIESDSSIKALDKSFPSPSYAALFCIQSTGSNRKSVNGWTAWRAKNGKLLSQIRADYLEQKEKEAERDPNNISE